MGTRRLHPDTYFIRDRKLGRTYQVKYEWHKFTDSLLQNLKDKFPEVNFIGIRVLNPVMLVLSLGSMVSTTKHIWRRRQEFLH